MQGWLNVLENVSDKFEQCQTGRIHDVITLKRDVKINTNVG